MYTPARVWSQQNQDSKFRMGVLHILAATPGRRRRPTGARTSASSRRRCGSCSRAGRRFTLNFWDYNDVAPGYFAAAEIAAREQKVGHHHARSGAARFPRRRPQQVRRHRSAGRGEGLLRHSRLRAGQAAARLCDRAGVELHGESGEGAAALEEAGINVKVIAAISEELFDRQPEAYRHSVLPPEALLRSDGGHAPARGACGRCATSVR